MWLLVIKVEQEGGFLSEVTNSCSLIIVIRFPTANGFESETFPGLLLPSDNKSSTILLWVKSHYLQWKLTPDTLLLWGADTYSLWSWRPASDQILFFYFFMKAELQWRRRASNVIEYARAQQCVSPATLTTIASVLCSICSIFNHGGHPSLLK